MPEISIIIPARNAGRTIELAITSVFAQTCRDFEVIVVDDGSTDDTASRVSAYGSRVTYWYQPPSGTAAALNAGLQQARGQFIAFLAPADLWMPRKLDRQLRYFRTYPETGLVYGSALTSEAPQQALLVSPDTVPIDAPPDPPRHVLATDPRLGGISLSTVMLRRGVLDVTGLFDASLNAATSARDLWTRVAARQAIGQVDVPMAVIRRTVAQVTARQDADRNLVNDTAYRRARTAVASAAHALDEAVSRRVRRHTRILFEAASPMSLAVFAPVLRQLQRDPRLEFWFTSCDRSWSPESIFVPAGITERVVPPERVQWMKFDCYVNTDFWDMTWLPRRTRRIHLFHGVAGKYDLDAPVKIAPVVATFDRLMFPNRDRLRRYAEAGLVEADSAQAALVGYPKVDCLVDGSLNAVETLARVGLDSRVPTVLYAPTWSPYSSLNTMGHEVVEALGRLGVNVIVKLHDRSYEGTARGSGGVDWGSELRRVCERHGARLVQDADASPWLHAADLLITDHSSVGFEFMLLDRPIVVLDSPELIKHARVNPEKVRLLRSAATLVRDSSDLAARVRFALDHSGDHRKQRRAIADELFYCPGSATSRAVQCLYDLLALEQPVLSGAETPARSISKLAPLARSM
jgi:hypothetical protein